MSIIDLSTLPAPVVVEVIDFESIYQRKLADFRSAMGNAWTAALETDPVVKLLQRAAWDEMMVRARCNDAARADMLAYAAFTDLDNLAAGYNVQRLLLDPGNPSAIPPIGPTYESDDALKLRVQLSMDALSVAGPSTAYQYHALSASSNVQAVAVLTPALGTVKKLLGRLCGVWSNDIIPFAMKTIPVYVDRRKFLIGHFDAFLIKTSIKFCAYLQAFLGCCCSNQINNHLMAHQWLSPPVHADMRK